MAKGASKVDTDTVLLGYLTTVNPLCFKFVGKHGYDTSLRFASEH